jgi:hypothetical protein
MKVGLTVQAKSIIRKWSEGDSYYLPDEVPEGVVGKVVGQTTWGWIIQVGEILYKDIPSLNLEVLPRA